MPADYGGWTCMRAVKRLLPVIAILISVGEAIAQPQPRVTAPGPAATNTTTNSNTNSLSTGNNRNSNSNSNSQFLSGNNTGVNNGSLEVYSGADPYQGIYIGGSTNLPQLPGIPSPPSNFSQPYKPDAFVNVPAFLPAEITLADAKRCRDAKVTWYGGSKDDDAETIKLFYAGKPETTSVPVTMTNYVGTAMATTADGPFIAALCEAAYRAMRKGATVGIVEFNIRPKNTMFGLGFGASGGATGLPAAGAHPYAIAGTLGFGTGWSNQRVEGEVVLQLTALRQSSTSSTDPSGASQPVGAVTPAPTTEDKTTSPGGSTSPSVSPSPGVSSNETAPSVTPQILLVTAAPSPSARDAKRYETTEARAPSPSTIEAEQRRPAVYHDQTRLASVYKGQPKDLVFGLFGTVFVEREGRVVEVQGMRLVTLGRPASSTRFEIAEVSLAQDAGRHLSYWFLFDKGRLLAWGHPQDWAGVASKYGVDLPYRPETQPLRIEAKLEPQSGR